jgi:hypothetical protein
MEQAVRDTPRPWTESPTGPISAGASWRSWPQLAHARGDDAGLALLRASAATTADGMPICRLDDDALFDHLAAALETGRLRWRGPADELRLLPLVLTTATPAPAPASPAPAPPRAAPTPAPASPAPAQAFDVAAMVAALEQAARDGAPFCEECARAGAGAPAVA